MAACPPRQRPSPLSTLAVVDLRSGHARGSPTAVQIYLPSCLGILRERGGGDAESADNTWLGLFVASVRSRHDGRPDGWDGRHLRYTQ